MTIFEYREQIFNQMILYMDFLSSCLNDDDRRKLLNQINLNDQQIQRIDHDLREILHALENRKI